MGLDRIEIVSSGKEQRDERADLRNRLHDLRERQADHPRPERAELIADLEEKAKRLSIDGPQNGILRNDPRHPERGQD